MLSHIFVGTNDFERALTFYSAVLPIVGWRQRFIEWERPWAGWQPEGAERPLFLVGAPFDGGKAYPGNGNMVALMAPSRDSVDQFYRACLENGATDEGAPGLRPEYHAHYYGAYVRDPEGNKLCVCSHGSD